MAEFDFDAVVVGAGAVGLACGYALSRRGLDARERKWPADPNPLANASPNGA